MRKERLIFSYDSQWNTWLGSFSFKVMQHDMVIQQYLIKYEHTSKIIRIITPCNKIIYMIFLCKFSIFSEKIMQKTLMKYESDRLPWCGIILSVHCLENWFVPKPHWNPCCLWCQHIYLCFYYYEYLEYTTGFVWWDGLRNERKAKQHHKRIHCTCWGYLHP